MDRQPRDLPYPPLWMAWLVWGLGAVFYLIGFYQRVAPAVMTRELMADLNLTASSLGHLSAFYFYAYVAMQIPTGLLADTWGPRKLLSAGALTAAAGAVIFALADNFLLAGLGRLLIGGSVAVAFVVLLKLATHWIAPHLFAATSGMALFFGVVGAVTAGTPLRLLVDAFGWRPVMLASGLITVAVGVAVWLLVRDDPSEKGYRSYGPERADGVQPKVGPLAGLARVMRHRNTWILFVAGGGVVGPVLSFAGLWGVPYLQARYGLSQASAAAVCSTLMVSWAIGSPILGRLSDKVGRRKAPYLIGCLVCTLGWSALLLAPLPLPVFVGITVVVGLASGGMILSFAFGKESVPSALAGTVSGVVNMGIMLGPTVLQPMMGWLLDQHWAGQMVAGARVYPLAAYQTAFVPALVWCGLSCLLVAISRETHCRQYQDEPEP